MDITIMNYLSEPSIITIDIENVIEMHIAVISGDEVLTVVYKDGSIETFDSSSCRFVDFPDYGYEIYNPQKGINLLDDPEWKNREDSYY